jgi:hypothetical protein
MSSEDECEPKAEHGRVENPEAHHPPITCGLSFLVWSMDHWPLSLGFCLCPKLRVCHREALVHFSGSVEEQRE